MFIVIEGPNGAGKTSLINSFNEEGFDTLSSPNGTALASMIRPACRGIAPWQDLDKSVRFMLFSAARYDEYVKLVHNNTKIVIADRWWTSTFVYQVVLDGLSLSFLEHTIHPEEKIDLIILLDGDDDVLYNRTHKERENNSSHGVCKWTEDKKTMTEINNIYRIDLVPYVEDKLIKVVKIDTTNLNLDEVFIEAKKQIKQLGDTNE